MGYCERTRIRVLNILREWKVKRSRHIIQEIKLVPGIEVYGISRDGHFDGTVAFGLSISTGPYRSFATPLVDPLGAIARPSRRRWPFAFKLISFASPADRLPLVTFFLSNATFET